MKDFLYVMVDWVAKVHDGFLALSKSQGARFTDKQLHFIVIGVLGLFIYFVVHAVFKRLATKSVASISWIYTLTLIGVITFAIEIGQHVTNTGAMEAMDIVRGIEGVLVMGAVYTLAVRLFGLIRRKVKEKRGA